MPCYDKKLEASRSDFHNDLYATRDVDCVITTGELELLMKEYDWDLSKPVDGETEDPSPSYTEAELEIPELLSHPGTSSGSYMQSLIDGLYLAHPEGSLQISTKTIRSADFEEHIVTRSRRIDDSTKHEGDGTGEIDTSEVIFRGAKCYGFRNLQNVVRKIGKEVGVQTTKGAAGRLAGRRRLGVAARRGAGATGGGGADKSYDYVEVMACPGGCINGGGQLRPPNNQPPELDAEGYARDWNADGVALGVDGVMSNRPAGDGSQAQGYGAKWGDREWTARVEATYWNGLPTPPPSPGSVPTPISASLLKPTDPQTRATADQLATRVLQDLCQPSEAHLSISWSDRMDEDAEARRRGLFRTEYRAVESEVLGIAVKW
jgi:hypothetical protein